MTLPGTTSVGGQEYVKVMGGKTGALTNQTSREKGEYTLFCEKDVSSKGKP